MIKTVTTVTVTLVLLLGATFSLRAQTSAAQAAADEAVKREAKTIQLRKTLEEAESIRKKGDLESAARSYEEAYSLVQEIGVGIETERKEAVTGLVGVNMELAEKAQRRGDLAEADTRVKRTLRVDPKNVAAQNFKKANDKLIEQQRGKVPSPEVTSKIPEIKEERIETSTLVQDARLLIEMGRLEEATVKLREAAKRDPENQAVGYYIKLIQEVRFNQEARKREIVTKERLLQVEQAWNTPLKRDMLPDSNPFARTNLIYTGPGRQRIQHKLDTIQMNEVNYDGIPLSEVVKDLVAEARRRDPEKRGINIVVNSNWDVPEPPAALGGVDPTTGAPLPPPAPPEPLDLNTVLIRFHLRDVTLGDVIDAVSKFSDKPLKVSIEEYAVVFTQRTQEPEPLLTRVFKVNPNTFMQGLQGVSGQSLGVSSQQGGGGGGVGGGGGGGGGGAGGAGGGQGGVFFARVDPTGLGSQGLGGGGGVGGGGGGGGIGGGGGGQTGVGVTGITTTNLMSSVNDMVRQFFAAAGIDFPTNQVGGAFGGGGGGGFGAGLGGPAAPLGGTRKALFYNDRTGLIFARATMLDLDIMDKAIQVLNVAPPMITIEAKFVEISQTDTKMLGFDWIFGNWLVGNGGAVGVQGGSAPAFAGEPSKANPTGIFPGYAAGVDPTSTTGTATYPPTATDQILTRGLRNVTPGTQSTAPAIASITGILTDPQFRVVIRAIEQRGGADVMAAPRVTTVSGRQTKIDLTEVRSIVASQNFGGTATGGATGTAAGAGIGGAGGGTGVAQASNFQPIQVPLGPQLDVIPYVDADGYSVEMTIIPTLVEFLGYDDPGPFVPQAQAVAGSTIGTPITATLPLPKFRVRQVLTSAIVWDGQTVMLGGLIAEDVTKQKDKVPVLGDIPLLGRLFRSESSQTTKKNLVIFVTPTIIDPAGNRVHMDNSLPYDPNTIPQQQSGAGVGTASQIR